MDKKTEKWSPTGTSQILIDACTDSIIILDKEKYIIAWNKKNEILTGFTSNDILGKQYLDIYPATSDKEKVVQALDDALMGIHTFLPADSSSPDGSYHETHYLPLKEEDIIVGIYIIRHDVTHRIKAENELRALNKALARKNNELKRLNEDILTFSKVTSYDFKDPARKAYDILELVLTNDTSLMETTRHYLKRIQSKLQRMNLLADDVLAYGQLQQVREPLSDVDINTVLKAVIQELQETIQSKAAIISIEELPIIKGYPQLLKQLFRNILSNALKFQKVGNAPLVTVTSGIHKGDEIRHTDGLPGIQYARISIEDNGIGFNEKFKEKIFNMFYRLLPQEYFGSGIGLAICRKVAEVHNGFIIASSIPNQGSKIDCYLPLSQ